jgi:hypothetical protein
MAARRAVQRRKQHAKASKNKVKAANRRSKPESVELEGYDPEAIAPIPED